VSLKVLITGAGGFIGKHLWDNLSQHHYQVVACTTTKMTQHYPAHSRVYPLRLPDQQLDSILNHEKPDWVVHCAGTASVTQSFLNPDKDFKDNVLATESLFKAIAKNSTQTKVIFISSAAVYGDPTELPIREDTPVNPISPYGFHKLMGELISQKYYRLFGIPITILRVSSVYGPGLKKQVLWDIYQKWLSSDTISLYGTGEETRDFIYINDLSYAIHLVMEKSDFKATVLNVATGQEVTVRQLASIIVEELGQTKPIRFTGQFKRGDPLHWQIDPVRLKTLGMANWLPIEIGIQNYVNWLRSEV
jgi:nucleoside-diphosphate-sugar epimerase